MGILGGLGFASIFYFAAEYEHMSGWKWALASLALSATVKGLFPLSFIFILPAQFGLFLVLWWANVRRKAELEAERTARAAGARATRPRAAGARRARAGGARQAGPVAQGIPRSASFQALDAPKPSQSRSHKPNSRPSIGRKCSRPS